MDQNEKAIISIAICLLVVGGLFCWIFLDVIPARQREDEEIEYVKSLGWEPENSFVKYWKAWGDEDTIYWKSFRVYIEFENEPWNSTMGHIWYNHDGEYYFEEDLD